MIIKLSTPNYQLSTSNSSHQTDTVSGRATDDIYIERFWRSIKHEDIYLNAYEDGVELWHGIDNYIRIYNTKRLHQSLDYQTPDEVYKKVS